MLKGSIYNTGNIRASLPVTCGSGIHPSIHPKCQPGFPCILWIYSISYIHLWKKPQKTKTKTQQPKPHKNSNKSLHNLGFKHQIPGCCRVSPLKPVELSWPSAAGDPVLCISNPLLVSQGRKENAIFVCAIIVYWQFPQGTFQWIHLFSAGLSVDLTEKLFIPLEAFLGMRYTIKTPFSLLLM